jgi:hypothetical protein
MTAASKNSASLKLHYGERLACETTTFYGEAVAYREETSNSTDGASRGTGPSTCTKIAEIMSGSAYFQQGRAATCKDSRHKGKTKEVRGFRHGA